MIIIYSFSSAPKRKSDAWAAEKVAKWDRVQMVRTAASGVSVILFGTYWLNKIYHFL